jgi:hypothetical protein
VKIQSARYFVQDGYPHLLLDLDGREAVIEAEQKMLDRGFPLVFIGCDDLPEIYIPANPAGGTSELHLRGFTGDKAVVDATRRFLADLRAGKFKPGEVK